MFFERTLFMSPANLFRSLTHKMLVINPFTPPCFMYHLLVMAAALLCFCIIPERRGGTRGGVTIARPAAVAPTHPPHIFMTPAPSAS